MPGAEPLRSTELPARCANAAEAKALFAALRPVQPAEVTGAWAGRSFATGHRLDGVLEACGWHGKRIANGEEVHPLIFRTGGGQLIALDAARAWPFVRPLLGSALLRLPLTTALARRALPLLRTRRSCARLRLVGDGASPTVAIVYDRIPVIDVLRRVDAHTLLGRMDLKGMEQPYFFLLAREPVEAASA